MATSLRRVLARAGLVLMLDAAAPTHGGPARADGGYGQGGVAATTLRAAGTSVARPEQEIAYSDFIVLVNGEKVWGFALAGQTVTGALTDAGCFRTFAPQDPALISRLVDHHIRVTVTPPGGLRTPCGRLGLAAPPGSDLGRVGFVV